MSPLDSLYLAVRNYPGGADSLAPRMAKRPGTLRHELRPPPDSSAKLGLLDAMTVMELTGDLGALDAMNLHFGRMAFALPQLEGAAGEQLMAKVAGMAKEFADVMAEVATDAADGRISDNELARVNRQLLELVSASCAVGQQIAAMNAAGKPKDPGTPLRSVA